MENIIMLKIPNLLNSPDFTEANLSYKWDENLPHYLYREAKDDRLNDLFIQMNHKSSLGLAAAMGEWIFWRLHKFIDLKGAISTIEPLWAGLIDKRYIVDWGYDCNFESDNLRGPKWVALIALEDTRSYYLSGNYFINTTMDKLALLARHITPDPNMFDTWLIDCIKRCIALFPTTYDRRGVSGSEKHYYDSSNEPPIPREFYFSPEFEYDKSNIPKLLNDYLSSLSWQENDFLSPPDDMKNRGFIGTPYQYKE